MCGCFSRRHGFDSAFSVSISIPSVAVVLQAGTKRFRPFSSTMHIQQDPVDSSRSLWQRVGITTPAPAAAARMVVPRVALTGLPLMMRDMVFIAPAIQCDGQLFQGAT
jgi:hypothetical protein